MVTFTHPNIGASPLAAVVFPIHHLSPILTDGHLGCFQFSSLLSIEKNSFG